VNHTTRAGQAGGVRMLAAADVEVVDATKGRRAARGVRRLVDFHHAMRIASSALYDFYGVVRGRPAACREVDGVATRAGERSWRLTDAPIPELAAVCASEAAAAGSRGDGPPSGR